MPDVHLGKGATVGSVIPTRAAIIPAAVGVDIGCGMVALRTTLAASDLPDSLAPIRAAIERDVPVGFEAHPHPALEATKDDGTFSLRTRMAALRTRYGTLGVVATLGKFDDARVWNQVGTLGGGNHFIELCLDEADRVWIMLHSGSRNVGNRIGEVSIATARRLAERDDLHLPDRDLAWLAEGTPAFDRYVAALRWAQDYAALNRDVMLHLVLRALRRFFPGHRRPRIGGQLSSQLRRSGGPRRGTIVDHAQGCGVGARRRARHHPGLDGREELHRARQGQRRVVFLVQPRSRP
jgi:tRNA-splicing ligase RtcB